MTTRPEQKIWEAALDASFMRFCRKALTALERHFRVFLENLAARLRKKWLRPSDAEEYLGISLGKLEKMRKEGIGPRFHTFCGMIFYSVEDLDAFMGTLPVGPTSMDGNRLDGPLTSNR